MRHRPQAYDPLEPQAYLSGLVHLTNLDLGTRLPSEHLPLGRFTALVRLHAAVADVPALVAVLEAGAGAGAGGPPVLPSLEVLSLMVLERGGGGGGGGVGWLAAAAEADAATAVAAAAGMHLHRGPRLEAGAAANAPLLLPSLRDLRCTVHVGQLGPVARLLLRRLSPAHVRRISLTCDAADPSAGAPAVPLGPPPAGGGQGPVAGMGGMPAVPGNGGEAVTALGAALACFEVPTVATACWYGPAPHAPDPCPPSHGAAQSRPHIGSAGAGAARMLASQLEGERVDGGARSGSGAGCSTASGAAADAIKEEGGLQALLAVPCLVALNWIEDVWPSTGGAKWEREPPDGRWVRQH